MTLQHQQISTSQEIIESGLDFILNHFYGQEPFLFPRKISTFKSNNKQFLVRSKQEIINAFTDSNFVDCKINAYSYLTDYKGIQRYKPNFIFIDLDKTNFKSERSFKLALSTTFQNIMDKLVVDNNSSNAYPTVIETGGGYHVYQPIYCPTALENVIQFSGFDRPSEQFLRFAKDNLSNGKADKQNNPSFKSCLLRIPGSINSKYDSEVKIIQKWNGYRPPIPREFIEEFRTFLIQKKIDEAKQRQKILNLRNKIRKNNSNVNIGYYYEWIDEKILANPFPDCRKIIVDLILAPYLINIKKMSYEESYQVIREWLDKCNSLQKLDNYQNFVNYRIHSALKAATQKGIGPMNFYKIKTDSRYNTNLYLLILQK